LEWYKEFWTFLKEAFGTDFQNRDQVVPLLRFEWNRGTKPISLDTYVESMSEGQPHIFYLFHVSPSQQTNSPYLEAVPDSPVLFI